MYFNLIFRVKRLWERRGETRELLLYFLGIIDCFYFSNGNNDKLNSYTYLWHSYLMDLL